MIDVNLMVFFIC